MEIDLTNQSSVATLIRATENGAASDCPFCKGRMIDSVSRGNRLIFLQGRYAGCEATVTNERGFNDEEFLVHFGSEPKSHEMRISYKRDRFAISPILKVPDWLCELSIDDLSSIDEATIHTRVLLEEESLSWSVNNLLPIVSVLRGRRLPVVAADLWPTFAAHGFSAGLEASFETYLNFALNLLCTMNGRPPVKRKRVKAMSIGRYLTPSEIEFYGHAPGIKDS